MKKDIHPKYVETKVTCSCGEVFMTRSTSPEIRIEICSKCHPFYTGKQKFVDSGGRVQRFQKKFASILENKEKAEDNKEAEAAKEEKNVQKETQPAESTEEIKEGKEKPSEAPVNSKEDIKAEEKEAAGSEEASKENT